MTAATRDVQHGQQQTSFAGGRTGLAPNWDGGAPAPVSHAGEDPVARAARAGLTAVWTGDCSGSVELARLSGPRDGLLRAADAGRLRLSGRSPWSLSDPFVRACLYENCLVSGTQFEIYRWVNLTDLAAVWHLMRLPSGVRAEWRRVLIAAGLLDPAGLRAGTN